jgi:hypothetical protein
MGDRSYLKKLLLIQLVSIVGCIAPTRTQFVRYSPEFSGTEFIEWAQGSDIPSCLQIDQPVPKTWTFVRGSYFMTVTNDLRSCTSAGIAIEAKQASGAQLRLEPRGDWPMPKRIEASDGGTRIVAHWPLAEPSLNGYLALDVIDMSGTIIAQERLQYSIAVVGQGTTYDAL